MAKITEQKKEVTMMRVFDAPCELVYKAWTDPVMLARWWGPAGFTNPVCEADPRPGGSIKIDMCGPDGTVYPMGGTFHEVAPPARLVFTTTAYEDENGHPKLDVLNTVTFEEWRGKTKLTLHAIVMKATPDLAGPLAGMNTGWSQSLERLGDLAVTAAASDREMVITRLFDAPRELVWEAWTNPELVVKWWGPNGFTTTIQEMNVRPGGAWRHIMHGPDGTEYPNESIFKEVVKPERISFSHGGGKKGAPEASFDSTWTFSEEGDKTRVTIRMVFESAASRDLIAKTYGALEGGKQTLSRLAELLASRR